MVKIASELIENRKSDEVKRVMIYMSAATMCMFVLVFKDLTLAAILCANDFISSLLNQMLRHVKKKPL